MKNLQKTISSLVLVSLLLAGCGANNEMNKEGASENKSAVKPVVIKIFHSKSELTEQLNKMKMEYEKSHPGIVLEIEGLSTDKYPSMLKTKFAGQEMPDIFYNKGYNDLDLWQEHLEDLSDQPWVGDIVDLAKLPIIKDGKVYGLPVSVEGSGLVYNKDLFAKAGITELPKTLSELEKVSEKLQAAGITPFVNKYQETMVALGTQLMNNAVTKQQNPESFIKNLNEGKENLVENKIFKDTFNFLDLTVKYGNKNQLTMSHQMAIASFGNGEGAMTMQGDFIQPGILKINPNFKAGILPIPINDDAVQNDKVFVGSPFSWVIYKESKVKKEAKEFLTWLATSDAGKRFIVKEFKFIPPIKGLKVEEADIGGIGSDIMKYMEQGKVLPFNNNKFPDGSHSEFGASIQKYIAGKSTRDKTLSEIQTTWLNFANKK